MEKKKNENVVTDALDEGRENKFMDIDRMINEGLGGGNVTRDNGLISDSTTDTMQRKDSVLNNKKNRHIKK